MNGHTDRITTPRLDAVLHQPVRTRLVAFLATRGEATFSELKATLEITDGNLDAHVKKLTASGYLIAHKQKSHGRPQTFYTLSKQGKKAFERYVATLNTLLSPTGPDAETAISGKLKPGAHAV